MRVWIFLYFTLGFGLGFHRIERSVVAVVSHDEAFGSYEVFIELGVSNSLDDLWIFLEVEVC